VTPIRSALRFALPVALLLGAAAPALSQGTEQPKTDGEAAMRVYKSGDKFVVAIYRQDGSAALALVEPPHSRASGKAASRPDMADLMQKGRVIYTVKMAAADGTADRADAAEPAGELGKGTPLAKLTRKQRADLIKQHKLVAGILDTIGKSLADGAEVGTATLETKRAP
jgi:hypothetical protein